MSGINTVNDALANIDVLSKESIIEFTTKLRASGRLSELQELHEGIRTLRDSSPFGQARENFSSYMGAIEAFIIVLQETAVRDEVLIPEQGSLALPLWVRVDAANGFISEIHYHDGERYHGIWSTGSDVLPLSEEEEEESTFLTNEAALLIDTNGEIDVAKLEDWVENSGGERPWARRAALTVNAIVDGDTARPGCDEMFLQQGVYPPISLLLYSFCPDLYVADSAVNCCHAIFLLEGQHARALEDNKRRLLIKPDAGIRVTPKNYVWAMLEIKKHETPHAGDMAKCVLETTMSLLAIHKAEVQGTIYIPFIMGSHMEASLFVVFRKEGCPVVRLVCRANMNNRQGVAHLVTRLALLLGTTFQATRTIVFPWKSQTLPREYKNIIDSTTNRGQGGDGDSQSRSSNKRPRSTSRQDDSSHNQGKAATVASFNGLVTNLRFPWPQIPDLFCSPSDNKVQLNPEIDYQHDSPFYFVGLHQDQEVFCKVWREGDDKTNRAFIQQEMELLGAANKLGVPSPVLIQELTALDLPSDSPMDSTKYHVLTMEKLVTNDVTQSDLLDYAIKLIKAVCLLHDAHILHCDIKPDNVAWDRDKRVVCLMDFGHAQWESKAKSYLATKGFEAPELLTKQPHSRATDAFSVGMTLKRVLESIGSMTKPDKVILLIKDVAHSLVDKSPEKRDLEEAAAKLSRTSESWSSSEGSPPEKRSRDHDYNRREISL